MIFIFNRRWILSILLLLCGLFSLSAQYSMGTTGLLNIPTADMQPDGTVMVGGNYMPQEMLPEGWNYNSGNYFANVTFFPWLELAYRCTLLRMGHKKDGKWNQDRSVSVRLRPLTVEHLQGSRRNALFLFSICRRHQTFLVERS